MLYRLESAYLRYVCTTHECSRQASTHLEVSSIPFPLPADGANGGPTWFSKGSMIHLPRRRAKLQNLAASWQGLHSGYRKQTLAFIETGGGGETIAAKVEILSWVQLNLKAQKWKFKDRGGVASSYERRAEYACKPITMSRLL
eukprot:TRINITY_DN7320_c0_g2_i1.p1 TRINITY_DN7320_c0_g2~~TRINITY_DN7320_c0_g2_i1.p1  ORF type:complete len:143 (-),score=6.23 TRINITY_DN7320_c0_g2_i1:616-1044(-)